MSGGSYNYLYTKDSDDLLSSGISDLESMKKRLVELGYFDAATETDILYNYVLHARIVINNRLRHMSEVFRAVEWLDSGDSSPESVKEAVERWRNK